MAPYRSGLVDRLADPKRLGVEGDAGSQFRHRHSVDTPFPPLFEAHDTAWNMPAWAIIALVIEDVTILSADAAITAQIRLRGGVCRSLTLTRSTVAPRKRTQAALVSQIDRLLELGDDQIVADQLNAAGVHNWRNSGFTKGQIANVRKGRGLTSHRERRRTEGYATAGELAARYNVTRTTIRLWARKGLLERLSCGERHRWYYRLPSGVSIAKGYGGPYAKPPQVLPAPISHSSEQGAVC